LFVVTYYARLLFINSTFDDIECTNDYPAIINLYDTSDSLSFDLIVNNTVLKNIENGGTSTSYGAIVYALHSSLSFTNSTLENITASGGFKGGVLNVVSDDFSVSLLDCTFKNVSNLDNGGVLYHSNSVGYNAAACVFERCGSTSGSGGVLFISSTGVFTFNNCQFLSNTANVGGNDIHHGTDMSSSYNWSIFKQTCSTSASPRVAFPGNVNIDYLLRDCGAIYLNPSGSDSESCGSPVSPCQSWDGAETPGGGFTFVVLI
jgi:hypothetical protein